MKRVLSPVFLLCSLLICLPASAQENVKPLIKKYGELLLHLQTGYVDSLDLETLSEKMIQAGVAQLDPHSVYIPAEDVADMNAPLKGEFGGIGVSFAMISDTLVIQSLVPGGPSEKHGLSVGDRIISVDGTPVSGGKVPLVQIHQLLRGEKGTEIALSVFRRGAGLLHFSFQRDIIPMESLDAAYEALPGVLYFKLSRFAMNSYKEFIDAYSDYGKNPKGLILDLRGNSGGYVHVALKLASQFLEKKSLILYTEGKASPKRSENVSGYGIYRNRPLVILLDELSASASEILAGAVQDWDRGLIVGRRSFGKGLVQKPVRFSDGSELRLTVARYHTPSGRMIQKPYIMGNAEAYHSDYRHRYESGELFFRDSISVDDSLLFHTLRLGREVYGGGGIIPDVFVPADTLFHSSYYQNLFKEGYVNSFVNEYLDENREHLKEEYKTSGEFVEAYGRELMVYPLFNAYLQDRMDFHEPEEKAEARLEIMVEALIVRNLFGEDEYYRILNPSDPVYLQAIDIFRNPDLLDDDLRSVFCNGKSN